MLSATPSPSAVQIVKETVNSVIDQAATHTGKVIKGAAGFTFKAATQTAATLAKAKVAVIIPCASSGLHSAIDTSSHNSEESSVASFNPLVDGSMKSTATVSKRIAGAAVDCSTKSFGSCSWFKATQQ